MRQPTSTSKAHTRGNSYASSTMSRTGSTASRSITGGFSSTIGAGSTRPTSAMSRPASSIGARKLNGPSIPRPATSMDTRMDDVAGSVLGKRKGMQFSYFSCRVVSFPNGSPGGLDLWSGDKASSTADSQVARLSTKLSKISLAESGVPDGVPCPLPKQTSMDYKPFTQMRSGTISQVPIATPPKPQRTQFVPRQCSPHKHPTPLFLTKNSSVQRFNSCLDTQWDHDLREKEMDDIFDRLMSRMNQQGQNSAGLKESVDFYKTRSEWIQSHEGNLRS